MTSSGTYDYSLSNANAVIAAFERVRVRAPELRQEHMATARREMNLLFAEWSNKQVNLWKVEKISVTMVSGTAQYSVPSRVVMILDAYIRTNPDTVYETDLYITPISRTEYASLANKITPGRPTVYWFNRLISPVINMWPVPDSSGPYQLDYYACVQMQDAGLPGGQTPDIPYLWYDALVAGLSHRLSRVYAPDLEDKRKIDAKEAWDIAAEQNVENVPVFIAPSLSGYYRR